MRARYFIRNEYDSFDALEDIAFDEVTAEEYDTYEGSEEIKHHTITENGVNQICKIKDV